MQRASPPRKQRKKDSGIICGNHISPQNNGSCHLRKVSLAAIARYPGQSGRNKSLRIAKQTKFTLVFARTTLPPFVLEDEEIVSVI